MFGSCLHVVEQILPRFGIGYTLVDGEDISAWEKAMQPQTQACCSWKRRPTPLCRIVDIAGGGQDRRQRTARGWWWTMPSPRPALQRPMEFGAHIVVHSSTKYIDGQGRALGGVILCSQEFLDEHLQVFLRNTGPVDQPLQCLAASEEPGDAGPAHEGALRERASRWPTSWPARQGDAGALSLPPRSSRSTILPAPRWTGGGGVVAFEVEGGKKAAFQLANALELIDISNNLGDTKSLITHPDTTTHQKLTPEARAALGVTPRPAAPVGGAGRRRRSLRRPGTGAESRLIAWRDITSRCSWEQGRRALHL